MSAMKTFIFMLTAILFTACAEPSFDASVLQSNPPDRWCVGLAKISAVPLKPDWPIEDRYFVSVR